MHIAQQSSIIDMLSDRRTDTALALRHVVKKWPKNHGRVVFRQSGRPQCVPSQPHTLFIQQILCI